jgi:hypothetical protein
VSAAGSGFAWSTLGGGVFMTDVFGISFERDGRTLPVSSPAMAARMAAPFVDWYLNPKGGIHLQGAAGFGLAYPFTGC